MSRDGLRSYGPVIVLAVGAVLLAAAILSQAPAALLGRQVRGGDSQARDLASLSLERLQSGSGSGEARALALKALDTSPIESHALSILGLLRLEEGEAGKGEQMMRVAATLSHRDEIADRWLYFRDLETRNYPEAFRHADALLRRQVDQRTTVVPTMFPYLADPAAFAALKDRLAAGPGWRPAFFGRLVAEAPDPGAAFAMLAALKSTDNPPTQSELSQMLRRLIAEHRYEQAYLSWTLLMPPEELARQAFLQDGGFDGFASTPPFGWNLDSDPGGGGAITREGSGKNRVLEVNYDGRQAQWLVRQLIVLAPGAYHLSGKVRSAVAGRAEWRVTCETQTLTLTAVPVINTGGAWKTFSADFVVPAECPGQTLVLQGLPGPLESPAEFWFDDLNLVTRHAD